MRERIRILLVIYGLLLTAAGSAALKPTRPKFKIATSSTTTTTTEEPEQEEHEVTTVQTDVNATTGHTLTGIPQIDYIWDPNLPRELNGFNLSSYPFYSTVPDLEDIDFKCDGLHDGFYASIQHKCQLYHHCLYGTRYDFLCANFTAFDQKTFICHFASEVDCANSKKYWHRNDALYQATTTTTTSTTTTTTVAPPPTATAPAAARPPIRDRDQGRRRRPFRRRPQYDYYDDEYYDEEYDRTRPRGYDRRDSYEYDDRNYRTDRDRERDRDYRDPVRDPVRDHGPRSRERDSSFGYTPPRDVDNRRPAYDDRDLKEREKIPPVRPGRRDRRPVDQFDEDTRPLVRDRPRDTDAADYPDIGKGIASEERRKELPDVRARDPPRDVDDRRYSDKRYRNDYDDKEPTPVVTGGNDGLVKPAAPSTSVYARPRAPPKIRRPVPVSEQNKYAYNASAGAASATDEPRRRPDPVDDDYVDDDLEDVRPRRPNRRRPTYREKEPSYDARETRDRERDRDRDRNYRTRYQDENEEEVLPRKRPDRQRDRHYERGDRLHTLDRDRPILDRGPVSPAVTERPVPQFPSRPAERPTGLLNTRPLNRDKDFNRPKFPVREREPPVLQTEAPKRPNFYRPRPEKPIADNSAQVFRNQNDEDDLNLEEELSDDVRSKDTREKIGEPRLTEPELIPELPLIRPSSASRGSQKYEDSSSENPSGIDYPSESSSEYYDEPEELPASSPRSTLRIVKRPFLPSRGGNPNPRGLKQVGLRVEPRSEEGSIGRPARINPVNDGASGSLEDRSYSDRRQPYDAYRTIQPDGRQQQRDESADEDVVTRPQSRRLQKEDSLNDQEDSPRSSNQGKSSLEDFDNRDDYNRQSSQLRNGQTSSQSSQQKGPSGIRSQENSELQKPNEVANRLQEIPESEYDVTLNDALTPTLAQESSLPSGFILPLHKQLERDANLQSSQRNYLFTRPTEPVPQLKSLPSSSSNSYPVPPIVERSRSTFPRQSSGSIFAPEHQQAPWQGYVEY